MSTPGDLLTMLGVPWSQVTSVTHGYDGSFTPRAVMGHWTAGPAGSDVSDSVLASRCYHACVSRSGVVKLGGWQSKQGHAGEGRAAPVRVAIGAQMTLDTLQYWQSSDALDDTTLANTYCYGVCLDNDGVGEAVPGPQWEAWCAAMAVFAVFAGGNAGSVLDHSASTNRKIDLSASPVIDVGAWWDNVGRYVDRLTGRDLEEDALYQLWVESVPDPGRDEPDGHLYLSDGIHVRWLRTGWDYDNVKSQMLARGYDITTHPVSQATVQAGELGVLAGPMPPW